MWTFAQMCQWLPGVCGGREPCKNALALSGLVFSPRPAILVAWLSRETSE
jgi:hypothetical protein